MQDINVLYEKLKLAFCYLNKREDQICIHICIFLQGVISMSWIVLTLKMYFGVIEKFYQVCYAQKTYSFVYLKYFTHLKKKSPV